MAKETGELTMFTASKKPQSEMMFREKKRPGTQKKEASVIRTHAWPGDSLCL